jgi:hypothetical protein
LSAGNPPAGYYADPSIPGYIRYWDGNEWVAGTSRPAPDEVAQQVAEQASASSQAGAAAAQGLDQQGVSQQGTAQSGAHAKQAVEQPQDSGTWQPEPAAPTRTEAGARSQAAEPQRAGQSQIGQSSSQGQGQSQGQAQSSQSKQYGQGSPQDRVPRQAQPQVQPQPQAQPLVQPQQSPASGSGQQFAQAQPQQQIPAQSQPQQYAQSQPQQQPRHQAPPQAPPQQPRPQAQPQQYAQPSAQAQFQPQQYAPTAQPQRAPQAPGVFPMSAQVPAPTAAPGSGSAAPQAAEASGTMMIPSAFGSSHTGTFRLPGTNGNPFAGLPGSPYPTADADVDGERSGGETTVVELATPGSRFLARIIDLGIAAVLSAPVTVSLLLVAHRHDHQYVLKLDQQATTTYTALGMDGLGIALWAGALLALILVSILYEGIRLGRGGQTFGKRLAGVRVVRLQDGRPLGRGDAGTRRALLFWVLAILPLIDILTLGGVLWGRPYRQGMHEKATSTATVKA